jgi:hypothetical protein
LEKVGEVVQQIRKISPQAVSLGRPTEAGAVGAYQRLIEAETTDTATEQDLTDAALGDVPMAADENEECVNVAVMDYSEAADAYSMGVRRRSVDLRRCDAD